MIKQGQATLEFVLTFIIISALIMGLLGLWQWSKNQIPDRGGWFDGSRIQAGQKASPGVPEVWGGAGEPNEPNYL